MCRASFLAGMVAGAAVMATVGFHLTRPAEPYRTLPRPHEARPAAPADPAELIPAQRLPTRPE